MRSINYDLVLESKILIFWDNGPSNIKDISFKSSLPNSFLSFKAWSFFLRLSKIPFLSSTAELPLPPPLYSTHRLPWNRV